MRRFKSAALLLIVTLFFVTSADANIFYTSSSYNTKSVAGAITRAQDGSFQVHENRVTDSKTYIQGFTFLDHDGAPRAMLRYYSEGSNDAISVWDPTNWRKPIIDTTEWSASNIHAVASSGQYLYLATYGSYQNNDSTDREIIRVDMEKGYSVDKRYPHQVVSDDSEIFAPHGEAVCVSGDKVYALFAFWNGKSKSEAEYAPSEIVEFDKDLNKLRNVELKAGEEHTGKNASAMAYHGDKLYVACIGGYQDENSPGGDIWRVVTSGDKMTAERVLGWEDLPSLQNKESTAKESMYGIQFADDGTVFILAGHYDSGYNFYPRLFTSTVSALANREVSEVEGAYANAAGYSWNILWDEDSSVLWCMAGNNLEARDKDGKILDTFTPNELGDNIYSVALLNDTEIGGIPDGDGETGGGCDTGAWGFTVFVLLAGLCLIRRASARKSA